MGLLEVGSLEQVQGLNGLVILDFWADWSKPSGQMNAVFEQLAIQYPNITFGKVDAEKVPKVSEKYSVEAVPHFVFLNAGQVIDVLEGANPPELAKRVTKHSQLKSASTPSTPAPLSAKPDINTRLASLVKYAPVMLFMKGSPDAPKCGFSSKIVAILKDADIKFSSFDIFTDEEVRQGLKTFSNWPTFPQLYVNGSLVGGLDIVKELSEQGELKSMIPAQPEDLNTRLTKLTHQAPVMLFMKGSPDAPQCGFSSKIVDILRQDGVNFQTFNILQDDVVRQGLKTFSNWPTFPQLYANGKLVGGLDIVKELHEQGELKTELQGPWKTNKPLYVLS